MSPEPMIESRALSRRFGSTEAVIDLDLAVAAGEIYGFLGPNGAGKTTTIKMLTGLLRPSAGSIRIGGCELATQARAVRSIIGLVPDTPPLYDYLSGREYIGFVASLYGVAPRERDARADRYLELFDLAERAEELCKGYSHGMRKKLHLAAVLATAPKALFLDEPTTGLDPASARRLLDVLIQARAEGTTVFLSTHVLPVAEEICDRVGILVGGRLRAEGAPAELRARGSEESLERVFLRLTEEADAPHVAS